jgi:hypothetical protein
MNVPRCNMPTPEDLATHRILMKAETCARQYGHAGPHRSAEREWKDGARYSLPRKK